MNRKTKFITTTAVLIAVLVVVQFITKSMSQLVTGSLVNMILIAAASLTGIAGGICVAVISPLMAFLLGIGPKLPQLVPLIALGNLVIVVVCGGLVSVLNMNDVLKWAVSVLIGAAAKFAVLYFGIVRIALPLMPNIPEKQAAVISASFGAAQFVTAVIGGALAYLVVRVVSRSRR